MSALTLAILALASAVVFHALRGREMLDFTALTTAMDNIATEIEALAAAIRNPATDNNSQEQIDALAGRAEAAAAALRGLTAEEQAEDTGPAPAPTPTPPEE